MTRGDPSQASQYSTAPAAAGWRMHIPRIPLVIPGSDLLGATQQFPSTAIKSAPRTEYQGAHPQGWPQETEQLSNHAMNHQPGILKGRCAPPLVTWESSHLGMCETKQDRLPTSSQLGLTRTHWGWTCAGPRAPAQTPLFLRVIFFLCLSFSQPSNCVIKGNLEPLTTSASTQEKDHSCSVLATWLEQLEIFSCAGHPGGLEANMWAFSWVCFVLGSAHP